MLSKSEKAQLIEIEKCERAAGRMKLKEALISTKEKIEKPFNDQIRTIEDQKMKALIDSNLLYISNGCGRTHPDIEKYNIETNNRIKKILRE